MKEITEQEKVIFDKILNEDDYGGVCASDFSGFTPEHIINKKEEKEDKDESI